MIKTDAAPRTAPAKTPGRTGRREMESKRSLAKLGMTVSLGSLVVTGLMRGAGARKAHLWSGLALVGFSVWHHNLYLPVRGRPDV